MINLFPPQKKKKLFYNKIEKLVIILGSMFLIFLICLTLVMFSIEVYLTSQIRSKEIILESKQEEYESEEVQNSKKTIKEYNKKLFKISEFYENQIYFADSIEKVSYIKPNNVFFESLSLKKEEEKNIFSISGFSRKRESLVSFRDNLREEPKIESVVFSPLSWAQPENVEFQVTFNLKNE